MNITFYSNRLDMRISRLALAAKEAGIALQLIVSDSAEPWQLSVPSPFSSVITYTQTTPLHVLMQHMHNFGTDLIHAFANYSANAHLSALSHQCPLPIVGDAYDMLNSQYASKAMPESFPTQLLLEQQWLAQIDGLCLRSRYAKLLQKAGCYHVGKQVIFMPEPCEPSLARARKKFSRHGGTHILFMLDYTLAKGIAGYFIDILRACQDFDIYWHILEWPEIKVPEKFKEYFAKKFPNVVYHDYMKTEQYMELMSRVDIATQNLDFHFHALIGSYMQYRLDAAPYFFSNKINETIECDSIYMIPDYFRAQAEYAQKGRRGISVGPGELVNKDFWRTLSQRVSEIHTEPQNFSKISTQYQGQRLRRFYEKVITGHAARTK